MSAGRRSFGTGRLLWRLLVVLVVGGLSVGVTWGYLEGRNERWIDGHHENTGITRAAAETVSEHRAPHAIVEPSDLRRPIGVAEFSAAIRVVDARDSRRTPFSHD